MVSPMGIGYAETPGIWSAEQVEGWKRTTRAVHEARRPYFPAAVADYPSLPHERHSPDLNSSHARVNERVSSGV